MTPALPEITDVVNAVRADGYTDALVLGMGGSSLAPEVFRQTFGVAANGYLDLAVLDWCRTPTAVAAHARPSSIPRGRSSSSRPRAAARSRRSRSFDISTGGSSVRLAPPLRDATSSRSPTRAALLTVDDTANQYGFRHTFLNDPNIGGRYSALSHFGLVPAALIGADVPRLLQRATAMEGALEPAAELGATIGELATRGRDKLTFALSAPVAGFSSWVEQLIAESTGKEGKGILPVAGEPLGPPAVYGDDRVFVYLRIANDATHDAAIDVLGAAGHPVLRIDLADPYDIGGEFVRWEMATAVVGWRLGINPFDQPNVESAKVLARKMVKSYETSGALPSIAAAGHGDSLTVYTTGNAPASGAAATNPADLVREFLRGVRPGNYVALQAYVTPSPETTAALQRWRVALRDRLHVATTVGYGPRFLHSTGQLHKGDRQTAASIIQIVTAPPATDVPIPDTADADTSRMTFGVLKVAQSLGDRQALLEREWRVLRVDPDPHAPDGIAKLRRSLLP